jgi:O-antigen ligase
LTALAILDLGFRAVMVPAAVASLAGVAFLSPSAGLVGLAFLSPFDAYLPSFTIYKDLLWGDLLMVAALAGAVRIRGIVGDRSLERDLACLALLGLLVIQAISMTGVRDWPDAVDNLLRFAAFISLVLLLPNALPPASVRAAGLALILGTLVRFSIEALPYFTSPAFIVHQSYPFGNWTSNPNTLAGFGSPVLPLALSLAAGSRSPLVRTALLGAAALVAIGVILSFSKGSWVAAFAGLAIAALLAPYRLRGRSLVAVLAIVLSALLVPQIRRVPELVLSRWTSAASVISNQERLKYAVVGFALIREHPLGGVGLEQFGRAYREETGNAEGPEDPHNAYLLIASELGMPALALYLVFLGVLIGSSLRAWRSGHQASAAGLLGALTALCVLQLFNAEPWNSRVFWTLAVLPWPLINSRRTLSVP